MSDQISPLSLDFVACLRAPDAAFEPQYAAAFDVGQAPRSTGRWDLGAVRVDLRSSDDAEVVAPGTGGRWVAVRWEVDSLDQAAAALADHAVAVESAADGLMTTDPRTLGGLRLELRERGREEGSPLFDGSSSNPLGISGKPAIKVAALDPAASARVLAGLVGRDAVARERLHLNTVGHAVELADHVVEFVGSSTSSSADLVGGFLEEDGEGIYALALNVADFHIARGHLTAQMVPFNQWGRNSLVLGPREPRGPLLELTDAP